MRLADFLFSVRMTSIGVENPLKGLGSKGPSRRLWLMSVIFARFAGSVSSSPDFEDVSSSSLERGRFLAPESGCKTSDAPSRAPVSMFCRTVIS